MYLPGKQIEFENNGWVFDKPGIRIVIDMEEAVYEIDSKINDYNNDSLRLTMKDLSMIMSEMYRYIEHGSNVSSYYNAFPWFYHWCCFFGMEENEIIPIKSHTNPFDNTYYLRLGVDFGMAYYDYIKSEEKRKINRQLGCKYEKTCNVIKNLNGFESLSLVEQKRILKHLKNRRHDSVLPFSECKNGIECESFKNVLQAKQLDSQYNEKMQIADKFHIHLYTHPTTHLLTCSMPNYKL